MKVAILSLAVVVISACSAPGGGCPLAVAPAMAPLTDVSLKDLRCRAADGDQLARLELGRRYEFGVGVSEDVRKARFFYGQAARPDSGRTQIYLPSNGPNGIGTVQDITHHAPAPASPDAQLALARLLLKGSAPRDLFAACTSARAALGARAAEASRLLHSKIGGRELGEHCQ